jgi:Ankyrin repeats (many copies)
MKKNNLIFCLLFVAFLQNTYCINKTIHAAVKAKNITAVKQLLESGSDVNAKQRGLEMTPLHYAIETGYLEVVECLVDHGADITAKTKTGWSALHLAAYKGNLEIVHYLINQGANSDAQDNKKRTACDLASTNGQEQITTFLKHYSLLEKAIRTKPTYDILERVIEGNFVQLAKSLFQSGIIPTKEHLLFAQKCNSTAVKNLIKEFLKIAKLHFGTTKQSHINLPKELFDYIAAYAV